jgi:hypothetical protein
MVIGKKWNLHRRDRSDILPGVNPATEEKRLYDQFAEGRFFRIAESLRKLASELKLDYFGVDCCLLSPERILLFEANPTMNFEGRTLDPKRPHKSSRRPLAIEMASRMIARALEAKRALLAVPYTALWVFRGIGTCEGSDGSLYDMIFYGARVAIGADWGPCFSLAYCAVSPNVGALGISFLAGF